MHAVWSDVYGPGAQMDQRKLVSVESQPWAGLGLAAEEASCTVNLQFVYRSVSKLFLNWEGEARGTEGGREGWS